MAPRGINISKTVFFIQLNNGGSREAIRGKGRYVLECKVLGAVQSCRETWVDTSFGITSSNPRHRLQQKLRLLFIWSSGDSAKKGWEEQGKGDLSGFSFGLSCLKGTLIIVTEISERQGIREQ